MKNIALGFIRFYQYALSPHFPPVCRYYPCCSSYAYEAVNKYGVLRGGLLAVRRLLRCHPFHSGGYDPVPEIEVFEREQFKEVKWKKIRL